MLPQKTKEQLNKSCSFKLFLYLKFYLLGSTKILTAESVPEVNLSYAF